MKISIQGNKLAGIMLLATIFFTARLASAQEPVAQAVKAAEPAVTKQQSDTQTNRPETNSTTDVPKPESAAAAISDPSRPNRAADKPSTSDNAGLPQAELQKFSGERSEDVLKYVPFHVQPKQASSSSDWEYGFAPYLFASGLTGTVGARGRTAEIDLSFGDIFKKLNMGLMGTFEARKNKLVIVNDIMWIKLSEERDTPLDLFYSSIKLGVNQFVWDPKVGYRLHESDAGSFDVLGGVRLMSVETNLNFRAGALPAAEVSERKTWATPVVGGRGLVNLSPKFYLSTIFDIGGGVGADFTGQFYGGAGYRITPKFALVGGYRYMKTDYDDNSGFIFDTNMSGLLFGAKFSF